MSKLQELINKLGPNGVEFKPLGELGTFENIGVDKKSNPNEKEVTLLNYVDVYKYQYIDNSIPKMRVTASDKKIQHCSVEQWDIFVTPTSETREDIGHAAVITETLKNTLYSYHIMRFRLHSPNRISACYIRYLFETNIVQKQIYKYACGQTRFGLSKYKFAQISIPFPPIEVQEEIVRILDSFSDYAAELQAELQARKQQYEYYRNLLLTFNPSAYGCGTDDEQKDGVTTWAGHNYKIEWKKLGEICNRICSGGTPTTSNKSFYNGSIPWLRTQEVNWSDVYDTEIKISEEAVKKSSAKLIPSNCVIIAMYGATAAKVCINRIPLTTNQACCNLEINPQLASYKYVYYWLCNSYEKLKSMGEGSQNNINGMKIKQYPIPIPPLELQEKIASILDRFETLVNDLTNGLPAEIAAVKDQYEYYRNKLLTFKKLSA